MLVQIYLLSIFSIKSRSGHLLKWSKQITYGSEFSRIYSNKTISPFLCLVFVFCSITSHSHQFNTSISWEFFKPALNSVPYSGVKLHKYSDSGSFMTKISSTWTFPIVCLDITFNFRYCLVYLASKYLKPFFLQLILQVFPCLRSCPFDFNPINNNELIVFTVNSYVLLDP